MASKSDFDDLVTRLNVATNAIAVKLQSARDALADALANAGIPAAQEQASFDALDGSIKTLEAMGASPANPVPNA
jgi:hypothetical protein